MLYMLPEVLGSVFYLSFTYNTQLYLPVRLSNGSHLTTLHKFLAKIIKWMSQKLLQNIVKWMSQNIA